ncbi:hypothetical protein APHAL10511_003645 [Amanita phalloides]|nr:hypothetical protein APHAL10511_003645 [Amanita phalloides]
MLTLPSCHFVLFLLHFSYAVDLYLHPHTDGLTAELSPERASFVLARHLDLELFEPLPLFDSSSSYQEDNLILGKSLDCALVIALDNADAYAVIPEEIARSYVVSSPEPLDSLSSVLNSLLSRAPHAYSSVYEGSGSLWRISQLNDLSSFFDSKESGFAAIELRDLWRIRLEHGPDSHQYTNAARHIRSFLGRVISRTDKLRLAVLTFDANDRHKRDVVPRQEQSPLPPNQPQPQQPIGSISTCFATQDTCKNVTNSCSGRGQCVEASKAGRTCFVCSCSTTRTGNGANVKTDIWVGESCERKDISAPFVLLTGSVVVLVVLVIGSISVLSGVGYTELPSTLLSTTVMSKRD